MEKQLINRYDTNLNDVLSSYDRILITGTLPGACYAAGITSFLMTNGIRIFDYAQFPEAMQEHIRNCVLEVSKAAGLEIEHVNKRHIRKEDLVAKLLQERGGAPGLVHVLPPMATCPSYKPWTNKSNSKTYLKGDPSKSLHYYFYFMDEDLGLCNMRVPTWAPLSLLFSCSGHSPLAPSGAIQSDVGLFLADPPSKGASTCQNHY